MATYREVVYMVLDKLKTNTDDKYFEEDHVVFLINEYRAFLLKQRYSDIKKQIPESNYQTICLDLIEVPAISGVVCEGGNFLRSTVLLPYMLKIAQPRIFPENFYSGYEISYITRDRMRYVGHNKFLQNIIYASLGADNYLYLKGFNENINTLEKVRISGVFENAQEAFNLLCADAKTGEEGECDILNSELPLEDALIPPLIELIYNDLYGPVHTPEDEFNNSNDDKSNTGGPVRSGNNTANNE